MQEATNALRENTEDLINTITDLNEENRVVLLLGEMLLVVFLMLVSKSRNTLTKLLNRHPMR